MQSCSIPVDEHTEISGDDADEFSNKTQHLTTKNSSDEHDGPDIRIEEFRCGFPKPLPKNLRIVEFALHQRNQVWGRCVDKTIPICHELGLNFQVVGVHMHVRGPKDAQRTPTLHICVHDESVQPSWKPTLIRISHMLRAEGALDLHVLIRCNKIPQRYIFAIEFDHPLVQLWPKKLLNPVVSIIESYRLDFGAVEVFRYGPKLENAPPTILITVKDEDDEEEETTWERARSDITRYCQSEGADLSVVFQEHMIADTRPKLTATVGAVGRVYDQPIPMGTSIGVEQMGTGTLGGYLQLKDRDTGSVKVVGLTTYQTVRGSDKKWPADIDKNFTAWPQEEGHVLVQSPSKEDHQNALLELQDNLSQQKASLAGMQRNEAFQKRKAVQKLDELTSWEKLQINKINETEQRIQFCQSLNEDDLNVGKVLASSGFRISRRGNRSLDWALIEIDNERIGENKLADTLNNPELLYMLSGLYEIYINRIFKEPFDKSTAFFKTGCTSGVTCGDFSHIKSYVRTKMPPNSQNETPPPRNTLEFVFVNLNRVFMRESKEPFFREGDAGAWLLDRYGALTGLMWGTSGAGACYVTPISDVLSDIAKHTGMDVSVAEYWSVPGYEPEDRFIFRACAVPWLVDEPYTLPCAEGLASVQVAIRQKDSSWLIKIS